MHDIARFAGQGAACYGSWMRKLLLLLTFLAGSTLLCGTAAAQFSQMRHLPQDGIRGVLGATHQYPVVQIGNVLLRLTPGTRIYDQNNRTIVHSALPPGAHILFLRDQAGDVVRIYILTQQELVQLIQAGRK